MGFCTPALVEEEGRARGTERILVVEDQLEVRETVQRTLAESGKRPRVELRQPGYSGDERPVRRAGA